MTFAITRKELKVLWASPLPYVLGAVLHATLGVLAWGQVTARAQAVFQPVVPIAGFLLVVVTPVLAARSFADEARSGTLELLLAVPVANVRLVAGKYLALAATIWALTAPAAVFAVLLSLWGDPDAGPILTGLIGLAVMGAALVGVGVLSSALTTSQPVAAIGGLFAVLALWFAHVGSDVPGSGGLVAALSLSERLRTFAGGGIALADVVFFASLAFVSLAGAVLALEARRWR